MKNLKFAKQDWRLADYSFNGVAKIENDKGDEICSLNKKQRLEFAALIALSPKMYATLQTIEKELNEAIKDGHKPTIYEAGILELIKNL